jgi:predicted nucleotidyltransferase
MVMRDVEPVLDRLCIDFYVVGAVARDIWLTHEGGNPARRMTSDVDLAISLTDETAYKQVLAELLETGCFHAIRSSAFALIHTPTGTTLDLMPFGAIAGRDGTVRVAGADTETISTVGFAEMAASAVAMQVASSDRTWRVALLLLKQDAVSAYRMFSRLVKGFEEVRNAENTA